MSDAMEAVKNPIAEKHTWGAMEAAMACYAGGGEGLYAALYPHIAAAVEAALSDSTSKESGPAKAGEETSDV